MMVPDPQLTIIVPALNEEDNIRAVIRNTLAAFDDLGIAGEVLVIDDGSIDRTGAIVREEMEADERVRLLRHETRQGIGAGFWDGVANARGEFSCLLPGDNECDPWEILRYYPLLEHVDAVIPFVYNKEVRSPFRNALSSLYRLIVNATFQVSFNYTNGTILYRKKLLESLGVRNSGFFFQTDILVRLVRRGYLFAEVPYRLNRRLHGASKAVSRRALLEVMRGYLGLVRDIYVGGESGRAAPLIEESQTARRLRANQRAVCT